MKAIIIIPTYNEQESIASTVEQLEAVFTRISDFTMSILIFDSQSTDKTVDIIKQLQGRWSNITLLSENEKSGLGSAYIQAMEYAMDSLGADVVFEFDADGSHQPKHIPAMLGMIKAGNDVVVGSRYVPGGSIPSNWAWHRRWLSVGGNWIARFFLTSRYKDFTSGFRATRTRILKKINLKALLSKQYAYKIHLLWALHKSGARIAECPISFVDREKGKSKFPRNNMIESLYVVIRLRLREMKPYIKMCCCGLLGMIAQIIVFNGLRKMMHPAAANEIAVEVAIICNFFMNNGFAFKEQGLKKSSPIKVWGKKLLQFNALSIISLVLQAGIMYGGTEWLGKSTLISNVFLILGMGVGSIANYYFYKTVVWKLKSHIASSHSDRAMIKSWSGDK